MIPVNAIQSLSCQPLGPAIKTERRGPDAYVRPGERANAPRCLISLAQNGAELVWQGCMPPRDGDGGL
jgi:hypothetical protein